MTPEERVKKNIMIELEYADEEYEDNKKYIENTFYFQNLVFRCSVGDLAQAFKNSIKNWRNKK